MVCSELSVIVVALALVPLPAAARTVSPAAAVIADPPADRAHPAAMAAVTIAVGDGAMNAVLYTAAGGAPHPTLLLVHGFPGNEQNLDLAQAARRAGWNVLTFHPRGSWGSPGAFSFGGAAEDAHVALAWLRRPETITTYGIDPARIAIAGHSMGGFTGLDAAKDDRRVTGLFLIDPADSAATARTLATTAGLAGWKREVAGDLPPLTGTSYEALTDEIVRGGDRFDLGRLLLAYGRRPVMLVGAEQGIGAASKAAAAVAGPANPALRIQQWPTDHSFSDRRIALADLLVRWLATLPRAR